MIQTGCPSPWALRIISKASFGVGRLVFSFRIPIGGFATANAEMLPERHGKGI
jgi:hypothetical protein